MLRLRKLHPANDARGHYGRNAMLGGYRPAQWGVFDDGTLIARLHKSGSFWMVLNTKLQPVHLEKTLNDACGWAWSHLRIVFADK